MPSSDEITNKEKQDLIDRLLFEGMLTCQRHRIGAVTMRLTGRDREVMESLTAKDFQHRIK